MVFCARATRGLRRREGSGQVPSCSQNAHDETVLVRCAQLRTTLAAPLKNDEESSERISATAPPQKSRKAVISAQWTPQLHP